MTGALFCAQWKLLYSSHVSEARCKLSERDTWIEIESGEEGEIKKNPDKLREPLNQPALERDPPQLWTSNSVIHLLIDWRKKLFLATSYVVLCAAPNPGWLTCSLSALLCINRQAWPWKITPQSHVSSLSFPFSFILGSLKNFPILLQLCCFPFCDSCFTLGHLFPNHPHPGLYGLKIVLPNTSITGEVDKLENNHLMYARKSIMAMLLATLSNPFPIEDQGKPPFHLDFRSAFCSQGLQSHNYLLLPNYVVWFGLTARPFQWSNK